jgi:2-polyprenyl-6-methoxyphenol hydroxylase-like FAD-dependent oxidoreductase
MQVIIVGAGIGGLTLALCLQRAGIGCRLFEAVPEFKPLGVGINLLPHATQILGGLGLIDGLLERGIETRELCFYTRHGQRVCSEPRGRHAGYPWPQISIHRADLHEALLAAVHKRIGREAVALGWRCAGFSQAGEQAHAHFVDPAGRPLPDVAGDVLIGCDGIHSVIRQQIHPVEPPPIDHATTSYRGVTRWKPFLTGASMAYVGTYNTGKLVMYPIRDNIDREGRQLINWVIELLKPNDHVRDWNRRVPVEECVRPFEDWHFDWLDVPGMLRAADEVLQYPLLDQNPLPFWRDGLVSVLGDAAHPMLPRGSNGAAQAIVDAHVLARLFAETADVAAALDRYEAQRRPATAGVVLSNRDRSPDAILRVVEERTGGRPFARISDVMSPEEIDAWHESYKRTAGFHRDSLQRAGP